MDAGDFQIRLRTFTGPFDLLLHLARRSEVDLREVPLAGVAHQFLEHLEALRCLDFELAGEFLVVAATLMELKSRLMLPRSPSGAERSEAPEEETGSSLVAQLIEYRRYKRAAARLEELAEVQSRHVPRMPSESGAAAAAVDRAEIWDLLSVFAKLVREADDRGDAGTIVDETPQAAFEEAILALLRERSPREFESLFEPPRTRLRLVGTFLAALELMKRQLVRVHFDGGSGPAAELVEPVPPALKLAAPPVD